MPKGRAIRVPRGKKRARDEERETSTSHASVFLQLASWKPAKVRLTGGWGYLTSREGTCIMGGLCPSGMASSASVEVAADAETMWSIVSDLESSAAAVTAVKHFSYLDRAGSKGHFEVGTTVQETRAYKRDEIVCRRQIVAIGQYSVSFSTSLDKNAKMANEFSNTSTLTVVPLTDSTCELVGSMAVKSSGCMMSVWFCCWKLMNGSTRREFCQGTEGSGCCGREENGW